MQRSRFFGQRCSQKTALDTIIIQLIFWFLRSQDYNTPKFCGPQIPCWMAKSPHGWMHKTQPCMNGAISRIQHLYLQTKKTCFKHHLLMVQSPLYGWQSIIPINTVLEGWLVVFASLRRTSPSASSGMEASFCSFPSWLKQNVWVTHPVPCRHHASNHDCGDKHHPNHRDTQFHKSIDWFKGTITGNSHISWENLWFPVDFPLSQPIE